MVVTAKSSGITVMRYFVPTLLVWQQYSHPWEREVGSVSVFVNALFCLTFEVKGVGLV